MTAPDQIPGEEYEYVLRRLRSFAPVGGGPALPCYFLFPATQIAAMANSGLATKPSPLATASAAI